MAEKVIGFKIEIEGLAGTIETATQLKRQIAELNAELKKTADVDEIKKLEKKLIDLKAAQSLVNDVTREQVKLRKEEIAGIDKSEGAYRRLSKELNDQRKRYKDLAAAQQDNTQEARDLLVSIGALDKRLKGIDATVGQFQRNVGGYTEALSNFFPKLGGSLGQVTGAIGGLSMGITQLGKTTGAANISLGAIGIALTAFSAISEIFATINQTVEETRKLSAQVQNFTQATGSTLQDFVSQSKAIATTYSKDVNEIIVAANTASKELGVSFPEALNAIELGFRKGADAQGEFLQSLREYPSQLGQAGFSLSEFTAIAIDSANQGIYSDKAIDAIKEFGTQTREQTKSVKDAFVDALGSDFTEKLFSDLNTNAITGRDALALVTKEIQTTGVSGKELQGLVSTVFVGAGEDAGRYVLSLGDVLNKTNEILGSTSEYQNQQKALYESNLVLEESQAELNELLGNTASEFTLLNNRAKTFFNNFLTGLLDVANKLPATFKAISTGFTTFFSTGFNLKAALKANSDVYRNELEKINKEDKIASDKRAAQELIFRTKTEAGIEKTLAEKRALRKTLIFGESDYIKVDKEIKVLENKLKQFRPIKDTNESTESGKEVAKAFVEGSLAKLQEEQSKLQKAFGEAVVGSGTQKELGIKLNAINNQIKEAVEQQNQILADASRGNLLKNLQQAQQLATLPLTVAPLKSIKQSDLDKKEAEEIKKVQQDIIKSSNDANQKRIENEKQAQEELYENRQKNIELAGQSALALTDLFSTLQSAKFKKDEEALNKQIQLTETNIATLEAKADKATGLRKKKIEKELANERILLEAKNKQQEELQLKAAKQEKKIAIVQSIIQGALAVQRALNSFPFPPLSTPQAIAAGVFAGIQTATIIAQPLAEGGVVTGQRVNQKQNIPTRSNGDNVLAYVKRGEVVLNQRQQSLLGGSTTFRRIGIKGFADGGLVPPISAPIQAISGNNDLSNFLQVIEAKTDAINNRIDRLKAYVVSDDIARDLAEGNKLKVKATL